MPCDATLRSEFGRAVGGVINTVTRSGTNDTHGTAYWFFRNRTLNARDRYADFNPSEYRHQAGGSLGGPIRKDKLFYFFNAEITRRDLNIGPATGTFTYRINDTAGNQVGSYTTATYLTANRQDSRYSRVQLIDNGGRLWYDGLAVQLRRRAAQWVEGSLAYTWSHAIDLNQGGSGSNVFFTDAPSALGNGDYSAERGSTVLDQRHRLVMTAIATPPRWQLGSRWANQAANGWQLSVIATLASSQAVDPVVTVSGSQYAGQAFTTTLNGFGGSRRVPFLPRTSILVDTVYRFDARLTKQFAWSERFRLDLNFEVFNLFNHVSDTLVNTTAFQARTGVLSPVAGLGVGNTSGGFPDGTNTRRAQVSVRFAF